jgi:MoaA/NifB/PqqE/SkfB family radical SAM enzyme/glycosyltransferase involved in cell wall biosynthesis
VTALPRISVVIPVRNDAAGVTALLDSLQCQLRDDIELLVVDDGSTDGTAACVEAYPSLRLLRHDTRRGAAAARNTGAALARGNALLFLDADTRADDPQLIANCLHLLDEMPEVAAFSGCYRDDNQSPHLFGRYLDACEVDMRAAALDTLAAGCLNGSLCLIRKRAFDAVGGFDADPRVALEDPELGCRLAGTGFSHWISSRLRVRHRQPGLVHYARELVPRTRYYMHLIRRHHNFNPIMGGAAEGGYRLLFALGLLLTCAGLLLGQQAAVAAGALLLALPLWQLRDIVVRLMCSDGAVALPAVLCFHGVTTAAICLGGLLGVADRLRFGARRLLVDGAVVLAWARSLASRNAVGYLIQFVTHRCNAHCRHCFDDPQRQSIGIDQELSLERIRTLAKSVGRVGHLSLTGGEPLLRPDLAEIIAAYYAAGVRSFSVSTNGSYPERIQSLLAQLPAAAPYARVIVTISVDGVGPLHDRLRGLPGLYDKVERSLRLLGAARQWLPQLRVHGCFTLTEANAAGFAAALARLKMLDLDQIELNRLRGVPADPLLAGSDAASYARAAAEVGRANGRAAGLSWVFARLDSAMFTIVRRPETPWPCGHCLAGRRLVVMHADGEVLPCEMLRSHRRVDAQQFRNFTMGRLEDFGDDLPALLAAAPARRITDYIRDSECRCSFECAIFATMAYRPWRLGLVLRAGANATHASASDLAYLTSAPAGVQRRAD